MNGVCICIHITIYMYIEIRTGNGVSAERELNRAQIKS